MLAAFLIFALLLGVGALAFVLPTDRQRGIALVASIWLSVVLLVLPVISYGLASWRLCAEYERRGLLDCGGSDGNAGLVRLMLVSWVCAIAVWTVVLGTAVALIRRRLPRMAGPEPAPQD